MWGVIVLIPDNCLSIYFGLGIVSIHIMSANSLFSTIQSVPNFDEVLSSHALIQRTALVEYFF